MELRAAPPNRVTSGRREIAAIVFTDIVGFSLRSHEDEPLALSLLEEHRALVRDLLERYHGREIKTIGDAFLLAFPSAVEAAECAVAIQNAHHTRNGVVGAARRIEVRIGIHLGDVMLAEGDVYGDGVNIAARLVALAKAGQVLVSGSLFEQIRSHKTWAVKSLGRKRLKNIASPIPLFRLETQARARPSFAFARHSLTLAGAVTLALLVARLNHLSFWKPRSPASARRAVAILPFRLTSAGLSFSEQREQSFIADGMTTELIRAAARLSGVRVVSFEEARPFRDSPLSVPEIGRKLGVDGIVLGRMLLGGNRGTPVEVEATWYDVGTNRARWTEKGIGSLADLAALESRVARRIAGELGPSRRLASLTPLPGESKTESTEAYLAYLKGRHFLSDRSREGVTQAIRYFREAVTLEPSMSGAYTGIAMAYDLLAFHEFLTPAKAFTEGSRYAEKALLLDGESAEAYLFLGEKRAKLDHDWAGAEQGFQKAIALSPGTPSAYEWYALLLLSQGRFPEAQKQARAAVDLDPLSPNYLNALGVMYSFAGDYERALPVFRNVIALNPEFAYAHFSLGLALVESGHAEEGVAEMEKAERLAPGSPMIIAGRGYAEARAGNPRRAAAALAILGRFDGYVSPYLMAEVSSGLKKEEAALAWLERAYRERDTHLLFVAVDPVFRPWHETPRFRALLKKLHLGG